MSRNREVGPRKERWESVQAAVDEVHGNRGNHATNSSNGVHRTGCVAPKDLQSPPVTQATKAARQANDEDFFVFFGLDIRKNNPGLEPVRSESLQI